MTAPRLDFAQLDPVLLELGLFRSLPKNGVPTPVAVSRNFGDGTYSVTAPQHLDDLGLRVLLALCALAAEARTSEQRETAETLLLWKKIAVSRSSATPLAVWQGTIGDILREAGLKDTGDNRDRVMHRLGALASVRLRKHDKSSARLVWQSNLLGFVARKREDRKEIRVAFYPGLSACLLRNQRVHYTHIELAPLREGASPAARILHAVLSNRVRLGTIARYSLKALSEIVYGDAASPAAQRKRMSNVRAAIDELAAIGWAFELQQSSSKTVYKIQRLAVRKAAGPRASNSLPSIGQKIAADVCLTGHFAEFWMRPNTSFGGGERLGRRPDRPAQTRDLRPLARVLH